VEIGYPITLDIARRRIVIIGGGAVAARKASGLLAAGATAIRAIAPKFGHDFAPGVEKITAEFSPEQLASAELVFAATDSPAVNDAVVAEARRRGILVCRADADEDEPGDFSNPALLRCGAITVTVSAGGSPALAAALRDKLADSITDDWVNLADALRKFRPRIKAAGLPIQRRREIFRLLAGADAADVLARDGTQELWNWARRQFGDLPAVDWTQNQTK
jgi:precorrin-2 dehydrogenase/sirohydrochlorin ferrochelatase